MKLSELLKKIDYKILQGSVDLEITRLARDNRQVEEGDLFICIAGARFDTHNVVSQIAEKAAAIIVEREVELPSVEALGREVTVILVDETRRAESFIEAAFYGNPAEKLTTIGITGSKGKTTTTHMLADILRAAGHRVGTIGTNGAIIGDTIVELANTTPSCSEVQMYLEQMVEAGCDIAVIECSSQGLMQHRVDGFTFDYGIFTNISTGDHIGPNEHKDFAEYLCCKGMLIRQSRLGFVNADDSHTKELMEGITTPVMTFGAGEGADYRMAEITKTFEEGEPGMDFEVHGALEAKLHVNLPGEFNVGNALAAICVADQLHASCKAMNEALSHMQITGRFDMVYRGEFSVCVDFAHNGYSTRNHLEALREYRPNRLICVFGADGNRSPHRRYEMGEASGRLADLSIITSGHNRYETFEAILDDIMIGMNRTSGEYIAIKNRKEAIRYALNEAKKGDIITILGLGHEHYQEEMGVKYPYSDSEFVRECIAEMGL